MKLLSKLFIFIGILCYILGIYNIWLINDPKRLSFQNYTYAQVPQSVEKVLPTKISISNVNITLPLIPSSIIDDKWETTDIGASYLSSSPVPGEVGNSVIYGHNWASIFGNLISIMPGDEVLIEYQDKTTKTFIVKYTSTVKPETTSILAPTSDKRITLYTCSGFLDSERFVAVAILKDN
ncbi:MAG TPA: sortase [Candidatus Limnocylindrales bacterium]|nr:sortase [Candidatus Limnocylindrales bacterium]